MNITSISQTVFLKTTHNLYQSTILWDYGQTYVTAQKMKFSKKDFFSKFDQILSFLRTCLPLLIKNPFWKTSFFVQCIERLATFCRLSRLKALYYTPICIRVYDSKNFEIFNYDLKNCNVNIHPSHIGALQ